MIRRDAVSQARTSAEKVKRPMSIQPRAPFQTGSKHFVKWAMAHATHA